MPPQLTHGEILRIVSNYIGISGGYLGDFTYRTLTEFYPMHCGLEITPTDYSQGTSRERFIATLKAQPATVQAKILRGVLDKYPEPTAKVLDLMSPDAVRRLIARLDDQSVAPPRLADAHEIVERALSDAQALLDNRDAISAVDRLHTALHGYLKGLCESAGIKYEAAASAPRLLRLIRDQHPAFQPAGAHRDQITRVLTSLGTAVDSLGTIRNTASVAHPNAVLIDPEDAMLVVNATRTILHYLGAKIGSPG